LFTWKEKLSSNTNNEQKLNWEKGKQRVKGRKAESKGFLKGGISIRCRENQDKKSVQMPAD